MKIKGISIELAPDGMSKVVTVSAIFAGGEAMEEGDISRMFDLAREAGSNDS